MKLEAVNVFSLQLVDGKWQKTEAQPVGKVLPDGKIENTNYQFKRKISGGVAMTAHDKMIVEDEWFLSDPLTGELLHKTQTGKFFAPKSGLLAIKYGKR